MSKYIKNVIAAPTCFGANPAPSSGSSLFLIKSGTLTPWMLKTEIK
jgi:hypothetical protein